MAWMETDYKDHSRLLGALQIMGETTSWSSIYDTLLLKTTVLSELDIEFSVDLLICHDEGSPHFVTWLQ